MHFVCRNVVDSFAWLRAQLYGNICRTMRRERQLYFSRALLMTKNAFVTKNLEEEGYTPTRYAVWRDDAQFYKENDEVVRSEG